MYQFPIGAMLESFRLDTIEAIKAAARSGVTGLQMYATDGEYAPERFIGAKRKELLQCVKDHGMVFSAICGDLGMAFDDRQKNKSLIERSKRILDLAKDLETNVVTTHIGEIPADRTCDQYKIMQEAAFELASYADSIGGHFAIETGAEMAVTLKAFLDDLHSDGVAVNMDPANFVMVTGDDPVQAVYTLKDYIVHTHAKDGINLRNCAPGEITDPLELELGYREVPLGQGGVDFPAYLKALEDIGYRGYLTIEREMGEDPAADIKLAVAFLKQMISKY